MHLFMRLNNLNEYTKYNGSGQAYVAKIKQLDIN